MLRYYFLLDAPSGYRWDVMTHYVPSPMSKPFWCWMPPLLSGRIFQFVGSLSGVDAWQRVLEMSEGRPELTILVSMSCQLEYWGSPTVDRWGLVVHQWMWSWGSPTPIYPLAGVNPTTIPHHTSVYPKPFSWIVSNVIIKD